MTSQFDDIDNQDGESREDEFPQWYVLKCQVNREDRLKRDLERRIQLSGLTNDVEEVYVPFERVKEFGPSGKQREVKRKVYPGYLFVKMRLTKDTWFLVRETPGIGDFAGTRGRPQPATTEEVEQFLRFREGAKTESARLEVPFMLDDYVKITSGSFADAQGEVTGLDVNAGLVTVTVKLFGKDTPIQLEYWQVEKTTRPSAEVSPDTARDE